MIKVKELEGQIKYHKAKYYAGVPEISDVEYDALETSLKEIDPNNPILKLVGSTPTGLKKVEHNTKMLSLNKTYKIEELKSWTDSNEIVSLFKIDGVSCSLIYENGSLVIAKTRGDGKIGENITNKAAWMKDIPGTLGINLNAEIRGEVFCTEKDFIELSELMVEKGFERPSSQRNIVAGLIGRKENIELCQFVRFQAFDLIEEKLSLKTEAEKLEKLKGLGFEIPEYIIHKNFKDIEQRLEETQLFMSEGDYQIDGLVFSFNDLKLHEELGATTHHPRYKMAYKFQGESKDTKIKEISWQVSRNGILTPIAEVTPVELSGAKISRVTLHNYGIVKQNNLKANDTIEIIRSGEVIPKFVTVKSEGNGKFEVPNVCPSCEQNVSIVDIRIICDNPKCPAQIKENILNFIQKVGIDDLSSKRLDEMIKHGLIENIPDLYRLNKEKLMELDKIKDKLASKLMKSIDESKKINLVTFLGSLGIQGGAFSKSEKIVLAGYNNIEKVKKLSLQDLISIEGFAEKSALEYVTSLKLKIPLIEELQKLGFEFEKIELKESLYTKKKICITGTLSRKRNEIEQEIRDHGGIVVGSVSKNTDFLLTNEKSPTSSKFKKAIELEITVISEEDFFQSL